MKKTPKLALVADAGDELGVEAQSLADQVYRTLRRKLMRSELQPHQRLKIRQLAASLGTSETPVREAILQLVRDGAWRSGRATTARRRPDARGVSGDPRRAPHLQPLAAERAMKNLTRRGHRRTSPTPAASRGGRAHGAVPRAVDANFDFHFGMYWKSGMPIVINLLETLWMQVGPLLNELNPYAAPSYIDRHAHENVLEALERRDPFHLRESIKQDLLEGGRNFIDYLRSTEEKAAAEAR